MKIVPKEEKIVEFLGEEVIGISNHLGRMALLFSQIIYWLGKKPLDFKNWIKQMMAVGVDSFPVTSLTSLFTGMVLALQTGAASKNILNEPLYVGTAVGFSIIMELGPVLTAIVIAGRVGAAITAELGTMKVTEQIDALYTLGTNPVKYLAVPRFIACLVMVPVLTIFSDAIGIIGGFFVSIYKLGVPATRYWDDIFNYMKVRHLFHGLTKCVVFGLIIAVVSCYKGFTTKGGAEGVGRSTTQSVVISMVSILVSDYFLSAILQMIGLS